MLVLSFFSFFCIKALQLKPLGLSVFQKTQTLPFSLCFSEKKMNAAHAEVSLPCLKSMIGIPSSFFPILFLLFWCVGLKDILNNVSKWEVWSRCARASCKCAQNLSKQEVFFEMCWIDFDCVLLDVSARLWAFILKGEWHCAEDAFELTCPRDVLYNLSDVYKATF